MKIKLVRITTVPESLDKLLDQQLGFMNQFFEVIAVSSAGEMLEKVKRKENIRVFSVNMTRKITPFKDFLAVIRLFFFLIREKPSIVHSHTPKAGAVGMVSAFLARVPHRLHTVAGMPLLEEVGLKRRLLNVVEKITYKCATGVYPNSIGLKQIIINTQLCNSKKVKVLGQGSTNGIDTSFFKRENIVKETRDSIIAKYCLYDTQVLIYIGRLVKDKGIEELIRSFNFLASEDKKLRLLLVGKFEDNLDPLSDHTMSILNSNPKIIHVGFQDDIRPFLAVSDFLVFPSYREGFPNVVLQALAMGLPAIVSNINGCNEIIKNNYNGIIINPKSEKELSEAIFKLINNQELYWALKNNARKSIIEKFERSYVWNIILDEYNRILGV